MESCLRRSDWLRQTRAAQTAQSMERFKRWVKPPSTLAQQRYRALQDACICSWPSQWVCLFLQSRTLADSHYCSSMQLRLWAC